MAGVGRPRQFDRNNAVSIAMKLFWLQGYNSTSLADLRQAMGNISAASFYFAFESKEALFKETLAIYTLGCQQVTDYFCDTEVNALDSLKRGLAHAVTNQTNGEEHPLGCMFVLCMPTASDPQDPILLAAQHCRAESRNVIRQCIERGVRRGEIKQSIGVDALLTLVDSFGQGLSIQARDGISAADLLSSIELIIDIARPDA